MRGREENKLERKERSRERKGERERERREPHTYIVFTRGTVHPRRMLPGLWSPSHCGYMIHVIRPTPNLTDSVIIVPSLDLTPGQDKAWFSLSFLFSVAVWPVWQFQARVNSSTLLDGTDDCPRTVLSFNFRLEQVSVNDCGRDVPNSLRLNLTSSCDSAAQSDAGSRRVGSCPPRLLSSPGRAGRDPAGAPGPGARRRGWRGSRALLPQAPGRQSASAAGGDRQAGDGHRVDHDAKAH